MTAPYRLEALARVRRVESWAAHLGARGLELRDALACLIRAAGLAAEYAHTATPSLDVGDYARARSIVRDDGRLLCDGITTGRCCIATASLSAALAQLDALYPAAAPGSAGDARQLVVPGVVL